MAEQMCGHEGCGCKARDDGYCSDYCARHGSKEGHQAHACDCGHAECHAEAAAT
ncbi:MAG: hypothetical protein M3296_09045 [Actinomycetota bacterium]|nr:hypothetical protein [Actinomycetota bacterium]